MASKWFESQAQGFTFTLEAFISVNAELYAEA